MREGREGGEGEEEGLERVKSERGVREREREKGTRG